MQVKVSTNNDILVIMFEGKLDTGTAPYAESETNKYIKDQTKVIMDLEQTSFVSSAGLRVFLATAKKLMAVGGTLRICNANEVVKEVLEMSGFTTILEVKDDLESAMSGF